MPTVILKPNGDGANSQWSRSPFVDNYLNVDEGVAAADDDTTFNITGTENDRDDYLLEDFTVDHATIQAVSLKVRYNVPNVKDVKFVASFLINGTLYPQATVTFFTGSWTENIPALVLKNPETDEFWTDSDVRSLQLTIQALKGLNPYSGSIRVTAIEAQVSYTVQERLYPYWKIKP